MILVADAQETANVKRSIKSSKDYTVIQNGKKGKVFNRTFPLFVNIENISILTKGIERSK